MNMKKRKNKIYSLDDVREWRALKKDELDLEKLKFHAEKEQLQSEFTKGFGKILFFEGLLLVGEKVITFLIKSLFKSSPKKKVKEDEKEEES